MTVRILVIEDNPDNSKLVTWILEDEGYSVECADSAEAGLGMLDQKTFDVILMDISLPGISGTEATRRIRQTPAIQTIPIIALTAHAIEGERQKILDSGVDDMLTKPINDDLLLQTIQRLLDN